MNRPQPNEHAPFYAKYIETVSDDVIAYLQEQAIAFPQFLATIPQEKQNYAYADDKWTIKEIIGHILDAERIFAYRVLRFSRNDKHPLAGFDEDSYVKNSNYANLDFTELAKEFELLRKSNMYLFQSLSETELSYMGEVNGHMISVRALLFIIAGHVAHHQQIIKERYL